MRDVLLPGRRPELSGMLPVGQYRITHVFYGPSDIKAETKVDWINELAGIPVLGGAFLFVFMFVPAALLSFGAQKIIPGLNNDVGFTIAMLVLLPGWNLLLWLGRIKLYCFYIPAPVLFGGIALVKGILMIAGIDDGQ
jgi:hypothetical protein